MKQADIIIAAAGQAQMIKQSWVKPGAAIIDVGTNPIDDPSKKAGYRLVGDCDFEECKKTAGAITPVRTTGSSRQGCSVLLASRQRSSVVLCPLAYMAIDLPPPPL